MSEKHEWMLYGAYGYNGKLIAEKAKAAGHNPLLAGRDTNQLKKVADSLGLDFVTCDLNDEINLVQQLTPLQAVLHCAGPYSQTAKPMLDACLRAKTHYLDITGEVDIFELIFSEYHAPAKSTGITLLPGVGFDVVPSDCLASKLKKSLGELETFEVAIDAQLVPGASAVKSIIEGIRAGNRVREDGKIRQVPLGYRVKQIPFVTGKKTALNIPMGDIVTAFQSTGAQNITVFMVVPDGFRYVNRLMAFGESLLKTQSVQNFLKWLAGEFIDGESAEARAGKTARFWAAGWNKSGETRTIELTTPHPIEHTTDVALACVINLLAQTSPTPGASTPAQFFGTDFIDSMPGIQIMS